VLRYCLAGKLNVEHHISSLCQPVDPCIKNHNSEGCQESPIDLCEENSGSPECQPHDELGPELIAPPAEGEGGGEDGSNSGDGDGPQSGDSGLSAKQQENNNQK
jgi:hypothetical protein